MFVICVLFFFFLKKKTSSEMRISDWSSDVCSSDLQCFPGVRVKFRRMFIPIVTLVKRLVRSEELLSAYAKLQLQMLKSCKKIQQVLLLAVLEIGKASCRERVCQYV